MGERSTPDAPHPGKRRPSLGTLMPRPQHARARAVGLVTGPHARTPLHPQPVGSGPRQPARRAGSRGSESARPRKPHTQTAGPACPHTAPTASGKRAPAARLEGGQSDWETARPRTPNIQAGGAPPKAPSCRPRSAQGQLARARAVGLVTGPHARTPPHPQRVGSGPRQPAQRAGSRGWESARPRTPHTQTRGAPPGHPHAAPAARKSTRCGVGDGSPRPHPPRPHSQWVVGPGSPPSGQAIVVERAPDPRRPTPRQQAPPPGALVPPPQRAKPACKSARCRVGDGSPRPHPPAPTASGYCAPAARPEGGQSGLEERPTPDAPHPGKRRPPRAPSCLPHSAQSQLARARAVGLVTGPHARTPSHPQPVGSGPRQARPEGG